MAHFSSFLSKALAKAPQPTYFDKISFSSAVAGRFSASSVFSVLIASTLALNFILAPPSPRLSSVIVKLSPLSGVGAGVMLSSATGSSALTASSAIVSRSGSLVRSKPSIKWNDMSISPLSSREVSSPPSKVQFFARSNSM